MSFDHYLFKYNCECNYDKLVDQREVVKKRLKLNILIQTTEKIKSYQL